jgi:WhiB family redox-sensing transcriptional regulator
MNTWRDHAACQGADDGLFFPGTTGKANAAKALRICQTCVVANQCLQHALTAPEQYGVWGGKTEQELRNMRRKRKRPPECGTEAGYRRHFRLGEEPCGACREGGARERRLRYQESKAG